MTPFRAIIAMLLAVGVDRAEAPGYARIIQRGPVEAALVVALVSHESHWNPRAHTAEDYGLGAIRARFVGACRQGPGPACDAVRASLLDGPTNLRITIAALAANRSLCLRITKDQSPRATLSAYAGLSRPPHRYCGLRFHRGRWHRLPTHPGVREVLELRARLLRWSR